MDTQDKTVTTADKADDKTTTDTGAPANTDKGDVSPEGGTGKDAEDVSGLKKALAAERKQRETLERAQRDAELSKLPELERAKSQALEFEAENAKLKVENMRYKVGMQLGLTWNLAKRLTGDTEEEMQADGAELVKSYKVDDTRKIPDDPKNKRPPNDAKKTGDAGKPGMNDILRAIAKGR